MSWIVTYTGKKFDFLNISRDNIDIQDIAHALSRICRFNGHCDLFYSVAEHSVILSEWFEEQGDQQLAYNALMHDAAEAYTGDMTRPLKQLIKERTYGYQFSDIEAEIEGEIACKYGLVYPCSHPAIVEADLRLLIAEGNILNRAWDTSEWTDPALKDLKPLVYQLKAWTPNEAREAFWERFHRLKTQARNLKAHARKRNLTKHN